MASGIYTRFKLTLMKKLMDLANDTIKVALYGNSHTFTASNTTYTTTGEIAGTGGYTTGGATLGSKTTTESGTTAVFDAADTSWSSATFSCYHAVIYDPTPCNTLICAIDFGGVQTVTSGTFTIQYASSGIIILS